VAISAAQLGYMLNGIQWRNLFEESRPKFIVTLKNHMMDTVMISE
jgi:hypothetical protein